VKKPGAEDDKSKLSSSSSEVIHSGGCHCGSIRFRCKTTSNEINRNPRHLILWDCNCSDCRLRRNVHFIVSKSNFELISGKEESLKEYRWGTGKSRHYFCSICGISPFYVPRSNSEDGFAITFAALDEGSVDSVEVRKFDGRNWDEFIIGGGKDIRNLSKV